MGQGSQLPGLTVTLSAPAGSSTCLSTAQSWLFLKLASYRRDICAVLGRRAGKAAI